MPTTSRTPGHAIRSLIAINWLELPSPSRYEGLTNIVNSRDQKFAARRKLSIVPRCTCALVHDFGRRTERFRRSDVRKLLPDRVGLACGECSPAAGTGLDGNRHRVITRR